MGIVQDITGRPRRLSVKSLTQKPGNPSFADLRIKVMEAQSPGTQAAATDIGTRTDQPELTWLRPLFEAVIMGSMTIDEACDEAADYLSEKRVAGITNDWARTITKEKDAQQKKVMGM